MHIFCSKTIYNPRTGERPFGVVVLETGRLLDLYAA